MESLKMLPISWVNNGEERILVFFKRNDQSLLGARHLQPISYVLPSQWERCCGFIPEISEFNARAFLPVYMKKSQLPNIVTSIKNNNNFQDNSSNERILLIESLVENKPLSSGEVISPVELDDIDTVFCQKNLSGIPLFTDKLAISIGTATYGAAGIYLLRALAYADVVNLTGNLTFNQISDTAEVNLSRINAINFGGFTFIDDGNNFLSTLGADSNALQFQGAGTAGLNIVRNVRITRDATVLTVTRYIVSLIYTQAHILRFNNCRFDCNNQANSSGFRPAAAAPIYSLYNTIISRCPNAGGGGIHLSIINAASRHENCVIDNCNNGIYNNNLAATYRNLAIINCTTNVAFNVGSTSLNCATDAVALGAAVDTDPQINAVVADEFVNTDINDFVDGYRLKEDTSTRLLLNGSNPVIVTNTEDIFGNSRPDYGGMFSIGVSERVRPQSDATARRHSAIPIGVGVSPVL